MVVNSDGQAQAAGLSHQAAALLNGLSGRRRRLPVYFQSEAAECGLACLAMVAAYHGHRLGLGELRRQLAVSSKGTHLLSIVRMAEALQLEARALKLELDQLGELVLPCVLHWGMDHFVVLKRLTRSGAVLHDPAVGERRVSRQVLDQHFTGVALELMPAARFAPVAAAPRLRLRDLMGRVVGLRRGAAQVLALALALEVLAVAMPFQLQWVVDQALLASDRDLIAALGAGFLLLVLLQVGIGALRAWVIATLSVHLNFQWLGHVFAHLLKLPMAFFEKRHLGTIQSCFGSIEHIQRTLTTGFTQAIVDGVLVLCTLVMMLLYSPLLAAVAVGAAAAYAVVRALTWPALRDAAAEEIVYDARQHTHFLETVRGIQGVRLSGRDQERRMGWTNMLADQFNARLRGERVGVFRQACHALLFGTERVVIVWLAALAVLRNDFTLGMVFAFLAYKEQFSGRVAEMIDKLLELRMLRLHVDRVADIVHTAPEVDDVRGDADLSGLDTSIELRGVCFRYAPTEPDVLHDLHLRIAAGECVAITGASGCGKTTLVKLLLGLMQPTAGEVLLGGQPLRRLGLRNYRGIVGTVMQDDTLYSGSVADNISFFDPLPDLERIEACARAAALHDEILAMPMGYHSLVGDIGSGLSGGQKQRLFLARALYRQPRILVLDEATSHLDVMNERGINETIRAMQLTRIIVAHRPDTIHMADRVIALEGGRVARDLEFAVKPQQA